MTGSELKERCKCRNFEQIVVVTDDISSKIVNMQKIQKEIPGSACRCTQKLQPLFDEHGNPVEYSEKKVEYYYANTRVCFIEPEAGNTVYKKYLDRFGEGICCVRERVSLEEFSRMKQSFEDKGFKAVQELKSDSTFAFWVDFTEELGILYEVITGQLLPDEGIYCSTDRIAQINISTPNLQKTIEFITDILEIGPWEVGRQYNPVTHDTAFTVGGEFKDQEFSYLLAILVCGNIEWEVIEPEKGELVYSEFIARHGIGFHHILQEIPKEKWQERLDAYEADGIKMNCKGSLGPVDWCYMDTEKELGFYTELRTDAVMDKLPDGYLQYFYPAD